MKQPTINILGKDYNVLFDYTTIRELSRIWNFKTPSAVDKKIFTVINKSVPKPKAKKVELTFDDLDVLRDAFYASIVVSNESVPFTADQMFSYIISEPGALAKFTKYYIESGVQPEHVNPAVRQSKKKQ